LGHRSRLKDRGASAVSALAPSVDTRSYWRLTPTVTVCVAYGRVLLLDIARDRYLGVPAESEPDFIEWLFTAGKTLPDRCRDILAGLEIAEAAAATDLNPVQCRVRMPIALDAEPLRRTPVSGRIVVGVARAVMSAWRDVRSHRLQYAIDRRSARLAGGIRRRDEIEARLAAFRSARPLIPIPRVCLHDCLALVDWLGPSSEGVELVMGVSPYPFSAHCWVQAWGRVIDDHPQSPTRFHPVLRVP
jgi:hypothetical protein